MRIELSSPVYTVANEHPVMSSNGSATVSQSDDLMRLSFDGYRHRIHAFMTVDDMRAVAWAMMDAADMAERAIAYRDLEEIGA